MRQHVDVVHAVRIESGHSATRGSPEADDGRPQPPAIFTGHPREFQGVQHRAVTGHFVVLVKDVQAEGAVGRPVVHRLERDQRKTAVDAQLGDFLVLNTMRPAPQDLSRSHLFEVGCLRLGEQDDIAVREQLGTGPKPRDATGELLVADAEVLSVTSLQIDASPQVGSDPLDVQRVDREPALVLFPRPGHNTEPELIHARSLAWTCLAATRSRAAPGSHTATQRPNADGPGHAPTADRRQESCRRPGRPDDGSNAKQHGHAQRQRPGRNVMNHRASTPRRCPPTRSGPAWPGCAEHHRMLGTRTLIVSWIVCGHAYLGLDRGLRGSHLRAHSDA